MDSQKPHIGVLAEGAFLIFLLVFAGSAVAQQNIELITPDFDEVKTEQDPKHTPKIEAPDTVKAGEWFDVTISVGAKAVHPSLAEHSVLWIALFKDDVEISRAYLHPVHSFPKVTFRIALKESGVLRAQEMPNHTAPWEATKKITVTK